MWLSSHHLQLRVLAVCVCMLSFWAAACPLAVSTLCRCEDLHNGVALNCSHSEASEVLAALKSNQALLGLIQNLVMHRTNIRFLSASFFAGLYIKRLDLAYNQMIDVDPNAFAGMSPVLQELYLNHNNLTALPSEALRELKTLLKLDLSNNTITDLQADTALPVLPKLYDLNLAHNNICSIHKNALAGIRDNVQTINLGHNCLGSVPAPAIRGFKQLMSLHFHSNEIASLEALSFMNLPVMNLLNLAGNKITEIKPQSFLNVPSLRYLYLTENHISTIAPHQFAGFEQLEMLDLTGNQIQVLVKNSFSGLAQLRQLYLGTNQISEIEPDAFANSSIVILILASNNLTILAEGVLSGLPNLQQLSLKDNKLISIHQNAFYNCPSVAMIDLSGNHLSQLPPSTFLTQLNLLLIDLSRNRITKTPYAAFNRRVGTVLLQENPLVCTEKVHMLQDGVGMYIPTSEDLICGGKPKMTPTTSTSTTTTEATPVVPAFQQALGIDPQSSSSALQNFLLNHKSLNAQLQSIPDNIPQETLAAAFAAAEAEAAAAQSKHTAVAAGDRDGLGVAAIPASGPEPPSPETPLEPVRPLNAPSNTRPSILNMRPTNIAPRSRSHFGSEISSHLPSREAGPRPIKMGSPLKINSNRTPPKVAAPPAEPTQERIEAALAETISEMDERLGDQPTQKETATPAPSFRKVTDIADNPNIVHPFPVPFLKRGPTLSSSSRVRPSASAPAENGSAGSPAFALPEDTLLIPDLESEMAQMEAERILEEAEQVLQGNEVSKMRTPGSNRASSHTLPPSIVLAPHKSPTPPPATEVNVNHVAVGANSYEYTEFALRTQKPDENRSLGRETELSTYWKPAFLNTLKVSETRSVVKTKEARLSSTTLIIGICLTTVAVCMLAVFVGLCIAKHRQMRRLGSSSTSGSTSARTNAYVAAQQAQMNMVYGTVNRSRSMSVTRPEETAQPWIYSPSTYSNYYHHK